MTLQRWSAICGGVLGGLLLFGVLTLCFIPNRDLEGVAARALQRQGYTLRTEGFRKALPLGIKAADVEISNDRGLLLKARKASIRLRVLPLLTGKIVLSWKASVGAGEVTGMHALRSGDTSIAMSAIRLEDLPLIQAVTGARVQGALALKAGWKGKGSAAKGDLQVEVNSASIAGVKISGIPLPDADYPRVQGMLQVGGGVITLGSFTLAGEGLYARLKGNLPITKPLGAAPLNLTLELMPKPEFLDKQKYIFLLLVKYLTSPGHYEIPVKGTFARPQIL